MNSFYVSLCSFLAFFSYGMLIWARYERDKRIKLERQLVTVNNTSPTYCDDVSAAKTINFIKCENLFYGEKK